MPRKENSNASSTLCVNVFNHSWEENQAVISEIETPKKNTKTTRANKIKRTISIESMIALMINKRMPPSSNIPTIPNNSMTKKKQSDYLIISAVGALFSACLACGIRGTTIQ